jgi:hypothetical protein
MGVSKVFGVVWLEVTPRFTTTARLAAFRISSGAAVLGLRRPRHRFRRYSFFAGGSGNAAFRYSGLPETSFTQVPRYRPPQKEEHAPAHGAPYTTCRLETASSWAFRKIAPENTLQMVVSTSQLSTRMVFPSRPKRHERLRRRVFFLLWRSVARHFKKRSLGQTTVTESRLTASASKKRIPPKAMARRPRAEHRSVRATLRNTRGESTQT